MAKYIRTKRNLERGERAYDAMETYDGSDENLIVARKKRNGNQKRELIGQVMTDLLCDLRHLADQNNLDFPLIVSRSEIHFAAEAGDRTGLQ